MMATPWNQCIRAAGPRSLSDQSGNPRAFDAILDDTGCTCSCIAHDDPTNDALVLAKQLIIENQILKLFAKGKQMSSG